MKRIYWIICMAFIATSFNACYDGAGIVEEDGGSSDTDADTDSDTDVDSDSDTDTDAGTNSDAGTDDYIGIFFTGYSHSCYILSDNNIRCWGNNTWGQLGYGDTDNIGDDETPASAGFVDVGSGIVKQITAGTEHTCVLFDTGNVSCWGGNTLGQLGYGDTDNIGDDETPASAGFVDVGGTVTQISAGEFHTCALLDTGNVVCWGYNYYGQLGYGDTDNIGDDETPASAGFVDVGGTVKELASNGLHTCALLDIGKIVCWGRGYDGQLGYANNNNIGDDETPASAGFVDVGGEVEHVSAGELHTCALLDIGRVVCWGYNYYGQLGYGNTNDIGDDETPASAGFVDVGGEVVRINASGLHTCALLDTGRVVCWGYNHYGQLGYGNTNDIGDDETPASAGFVDVGGEVAKISGGGRYTCALIKDDSNNIVCWGLAAEGQLGYGNINDVGDNEYPSTVGFVPVN